LPCARPHPRRTRCEPATTGVGAGAAWSTNAATLVVSHTCSLPRSRNPAMTASMTESWTITRDTGAMTRSPAFASRAATRERIFSARVLGNDPLPKQRVELIHRQGAGVGERLDPAGDLPQLILTELEAELLRAVVNRVLAGKAVGHVDRSREPEVGGIQDLVAVRIQIDRLRVHARLVVEGVLAGYEIVVRDLDADERGHELVEVPQLRKVVLLADRRRIVRVHPCHEAAERGDAVALPDAEHAGVDVGGPAFENGVAVGDRAPGVVVTVELDVAPHVMSQLDCERIALPRGRDADRVRDADAVHAHPVHCRIDLEEIAFGGAKAVLAREADLLAVIADERDHLAGVLDDLVDALPVAELAQDRGCPKKDVDAIDAGLHGNARVVHVAAHVGEHLRSERQRGNRAAILERLGRSDRRGELDVLDSERIQELRDGDLIRRREMSVRELLALTERGVDDREALERHADLPYDAVRPPSAQRLGARRATEPLPLAWSHGSASRRGFPRRDSPPPSGRWTSPRSRDGPLTSAVTPFAPRLAEARSSAVLLLVTAPLAGNAYEV